MHQMLRFAEQNVSRKMDGKACPADGFGTRSFVPGSCSDDVHWNCQFRRNFHTLTFKKNWRMSRTKASFSHLLLSLFEGSLARKLRFTSSTFRFFGKSRTKASFLHLQLSEFEKSRIVMAASRLLGAAAACVILLSFAPGHRTSY